MAFNDYGGAYAGIKDPARPDHEFGGLNPRPASARGDGVLALVRSDDVDATLASVMAPYPGGRRFTFADPWGNILGVYQPSE